MCARACARIACAPVCLVSVFTIIITSHGCQTSVCVFARLRVCSSVSLAPLLITTLKSVIMEQSVFKVCMLASRIRLSLDQHCEYLAPYESQFYKNKAKIPPLKAKRMRVLFF